jgi:hypothetical protein
VIEQFLKTTKYRKPGMFPADPFQAARYWMAHQQPCDDFTEAVTPPNTKGGTWGTPYHDRLVYTLRKFLKQKSIQQVFLIEHIEKGVTWKGDEIKFYQTVVEESLKMAQNKEKYIEDGFKAMHRALRGMVA